MTAATSAHRSTVVAALVCLAVVMSLPVSADAQSPTPTLERVISGVVTEAGSETPIAGATVLAERMQVTTDAGGHFSLRVGNGAVEVTVTAERHFALTVVIDTRSGDVDGAALSLARDTGFTTSVAVVGSVPRQAAPAAQTVEPVQVLRTPGGLDNVFRSLQTLPGVAATAEFGSRLSVRGGGPDQNLTMMDGVEVHDPYRLFSLTSAFNPEIIQTFELATGGFSVKYGDRLSSLLLVENRDGRAEPRIKGSASLSITDANGVVEGGLPKGAVGSWLVTGRRTYYDLVAARIANQDFPAFSDVQARGTWAPTDGTRVTVFSLTSRQRAALDLDNDDVRGDFQDDTDNDLAWLRVDASLGAAGHSRTIVGYSDTRSRLGVDASFQDTRQRSNAPGVDSVGLSTVRFTRTLGIRDISLRQELVWGRKAHAIETGFEAHRLSTSQRFANAGDRNPAAASGSSVQEGVGVPELLASANTGTRAGAWLQDTWRVGSRLSVESGLRLDHAGVTGETHMSPRFSATMTPTDRIRVLLATGRYTQSVGYEKLARNDYLLDVVVRSRASAVLDTSADVRSLTSERAWQTSLGVEGQLGAGVTVKVEGYHKRFSDLLLARLEPEAERLARVARYDFPAALASDIPADPLITTIPSNDGRGRAYGFDVFVSRPGGGRLTGWTSYTWSKADREAYGRIHPFEYDRRHAFTLVSSVSLTRRWDVAATTRIASGFPRTAPLGVRVAGREDSLDLDGDGVTDEILPARDRNGLLEYNVDLGSVANLNGARLPLFARVDGRLTWRPRGAAGRWEFYAEVINLLNRKNIGALDPQLAYDPMENRPGIVEQPDQAIPRLPAVGARFRF